MKKLRMCLIGLGVFLAATLGTGAAVQAVDLNEHLKKELKKQEAQISQDLFGNGNYKVVGVKFKGSLDADYKLNNRELPTEPVVAGQRVVRNCGSSDLEEQFEFSKTEEQSYEITNSETISTSVSATVSADIPFTGAGIESSFSLSVDTTESTTKGKMKSNVWSDTTSYATHPGKKATVQFIIHESKADSVDYSGNITASGSADVKMAIEDREARKKGGKVSLYKDAKYKGHMTYFHPGDYISLKSGKRKPGNPDNDAISSIKIKGQATITVYEHVNYKGDSKTFTKSAKYVGKKWNDRISSFKVHGVPQTKSITIDKYLTEDQRSIKIIGKLKAALGVESYVSVTEKNADCDEDDAVSTVSVHHDSSLKNIKVIPGGKIISRKTRR